MSHCDNEKSGQKKTNWRKKARSVLQTLIIKQLDVLSYDLVDKVVKEVIDQEGRIDVLCEECIDNMFYKGSAVIGIAVASPRPVFFVLVYIMPFSCLV